MFNGSGRTGDNDVCGMFSFTQSSTPSTEPKAQEVVRPKRRMATPILLGLLGLMMAGLVAYTLVNAGPHSRVVTVCDAGLSWTSDKPDTYKFETSDGDFAIVHPDGALVEEGKVYMFEWTGTEPLTSFNEVKGVAPASCE